MTQLIHYVFYEPYRGAVGTILCMRGGRMRDNFAPVRCVDDAEVTCLMCIALDSWGRGDDVGLLLRLLKQGWTLRPAMVA